MIIYDQHLFRFSSLPYSLGPSRWPWPLGPWLWAQRTPFSWVSCCAHISRFVFRSRNAITQPVRSFHRSFVRSLILLLVRSHCSVLKFSFETAFHFSQPTPRLHVRVCVCVCQRLFICFYDLLAYNFY